MDEYSSCRLCPRECGVNRRDTLGFCGQSDKIKIARYQRHMWEEPPISGSRGSGTVFFSGCTLKCVYCQNYDVSRGMGQEISEERLAEIFLELQEAGCHNISIVTGTHFIPGVKRAIDMIRPGLKIPVVFNCGGYESVETVKGLEGYVDIYLPDLKYKSAEMSKKYSACGDYYEKALDAVAEMLRQAPRVESDGDGIMKKGVIVRHLVLPGGWRDSVELLEGLAGRCGVDGYYLSLMSQYTPMPSCAAFHEINRKITSYEYRKVREKALELGFDGFLQDRESSGEDYIPSFGENDVKVK